MILLIYLVRNCSAIGAVIDFMSAGDEETVRLYLLLCTSTILKPYFPVRCLITHTHTHTHTHSQRQWCLHTLVFLLSDNEHNQVEALRRPEFEVGPYYLASFPGLLHSSLVVQILHEHARPGNMQGLGTRL